MSLEKLWRVTIDAASKTSEFKEHYDFAGEVGPHVVLKLLVQREYLRGAIGKAATLYNRADHPAALLLVKTLIEDDAAWAKEKQKIDDGPLSL